MLTRFSWLVALVLCFLAAAASAQTPLFEGELGAPIYETQSRANGVGWIAYGDIYPAGTFDQRPACSPPNVIAIGRYTARVEWGGPEFYSVTYRLTFGRGSTARQFVFSGVIEYLVDELAGPLTGEHSAAELTGGNFAGDFQVQFTARSSLCLGGAVQVIEPGGSVTQMRQDEFLNHVGEVEVFRQGGGNFHRLAKLNQCRPHTNALRNPTGGNSQGVTCAEPGGTG